MFVYCYGSRSVVRTTFQALQLIFQGSLPRYCVYVLFPPPVQVLSFTIPADQANKNRYKRILTHRHMEYNGARCLVQACKTGQIKYYGLYTSIQPVPVPPCHTFFFSKLKSDSRAQFIYSIVFFLCFGWMSLHFLCTLIVKWNFNPPIHGEVHRIVQHKTLAFSSERKLRYHLQHSDMCDSVLFSAG